jgi:chromosome segregation ATPase
VYQEDAERRKSVLKEAKRRRQAGKGKGQEEGTEEEAETQPIFAAAALDRYRELLVMAMADGDLVAAEGAHLAAARQKYGITTAQHQKLLAGVMTEVGVGRSEGRRGSTRKEKHEAKMRLLMEEEEKARAMLYDAKEQARKDLEQARAEEELRARKLAKERAKKAEEKVKRAQEKAKREEDMKITRARQEERAKEREARVKAKSESEEKAKQEAQQKQKREAEKVRKQAEEAARKAAAEKAERQAEEKEAQAAAEIKQIKETGEKAKRLADKRAQQAEKQASQEAEAMVQQEAEEKAKREAGEKARKEAEEKTRLDAEEGTQAAPPKRATSLAQAAKAQPGPSLAPQEVQEVQEVRLEQEQQIVDDKPEMSAEEKHYLDMVVRIQSLTRGSLFRFAVHRARVKAQNEKGKMMPIGGTTAGRSGWYQIGEDVKFMHVDPEGKWQQRGNTVNIRVWRLERSRARAQLRAVHRLQSMIRGRRARREVHHLVSGLLRS